MKTRAAIAVAPNQPLEIGEVDLEGPRAGEVLVYVNTDDIAGSLARVAALGGQVDGPPVEVAGMQWAFFRDPSGNRVGLYTGPSAAPQTASV